MLDLRWLLLASLCACTSRGAEVLVDATPVVVTAPPASPGLQMTAGLQQTCALQDGEVYCWGYNGHGELGDGTRTDRRAPAPVVGVKDAVAVVLGAWHGCALRAGGTVVCWGDGARGQIGDGATATRLQPVGVPGLTGVTALSASDTQTCALGQGGKVMCWGDRHGESDDEHGSLRPREIAGIAGASAIAAGPGFGCAIVGGRVRCWGLHVPLPDGVEVKPISEVPGVDAAVELAVGDRHICARTDAGSVQCWGEGRDGQRGDGVRDELPGRWHGPHPPPMPRTAHPVVTVVGLDEVVRLAAGSDFTCALRKGGDLRCWGAGRDGQLGDGGDAPRATPVVVPLEGISSMSLGSAHACAVLRAGGARCWGYNDAGQADNAAPETRLAPYVAFSAGPKDRSGAASIAASGRHACVVRGGQVECLGDNEFGQLGDGTRMTRVAPVSVPGLVDAVEIAVGLRHSCVRRSGGEVVCWGDDTFGQLGQPGAPVGEQRDEHGLGEPPPPASERSRTTPIAVAGISGALQIVARGHYTCALLDTGVLRCWHGEGASALAEPVRLPTDTVEVGLGAVHSCARRNSGQVLCWGLNFYGRIGDGTRIDRPQPTAVKGLSDATGIAVGLLSSCARRHSGDVVCWGSNFGGQLGDGSEEERATIVPVVGLRDVDKLVAGEDHSCARRSSGEVLCWGTNDEGALGDGTTSTRVVPVPVAGLGPVVALAAGEQQSCALAASGAVHCWGRDLRAPGVPRRWDNTRVPAVVTGLPTR